MTKRVLVTGASGFIGRHVLAPLVAHGFEVHASLRNAAAERNRDFVVHCTDLLRPGAAATLVAQVEPSHLLHLAWAKPSEAWVTLDNLSWAAASLDLYRAFVEADGKRAVLAGSCAEYDWSYEILHEAETPSNPRSLYGCAKNSVRELVEQTGHQLGVCTAWARIFYLYGPYEPRGRLVADVVNALLCGRRAAVTHGRQERDFMHVADVAEALVALLDGEVTGTVNIASGRCMPVRHIVESLGHLAARPDLLAFGALQPPPEEPLRLAADTSRLTHEVGFAPRYQLEEGLAATFDWWRRGLKQN